MDDLDQLIDSYVQRQPQPQPQPQAVTQQQPADHLDTLIDDYVRSARIAARPQPQAPQPDLASLVSLPANPIEAPPDQQPIPPSQLAALRTIHANMLAEPDAHVMPPMTHGVGTEIANVGQNIYGSLQRTAAGAAAVGAPFAMSAVPPALQPVVESSIDQGSEDVRRAANQRILSHPVESAPGELAAQAVPIGAMLGAGVVSGGAAPALWGVIGAADMHTRAMDATEQAVRQGLMTPAEAHQMAMAEAGWGAFTGYLTALLPGFGKVSTSTAQSLFRTVLAGGAQSLSNDLAANYGLPNQKPVVDAIVDAGIAASVAGVLHGLFHIFDTAPGDVRAAASAVAPEPVVDIAAQRWAAYQSGKMTREEALRPENMSAGDVRQIFNYFRRQEGAAPSTPAQNQNEAPQAAPQAPPDATGATEPTQPGPLPVPAENAPESQPQGIVGAPPGATAVDNLDQGTTPLNAIRGLVNPLAKGPSNAVPPPRNVREVAANGQPPAGGGVPAPAPATAEQPPAGAVAPGPADAAQHAAQEGQVSQAPAVAQGAVGYTPAVAQENGAGPAPTPSQPPTGPTGDNARWKAKPDGFSALLDKLPRADLQQLLAENGLELNDSDNIVFRDKRGGGGVTRMNKREFVDWVLGNHPNDDPATYGQNDPQWMDLLNRARAIAGTRSFEQAAPALLDKRMDLRDGQPKLTVRDSMMDAGSRGWDYPTWARNFKHTAATLGDNGPRLWDARGQGAPNALQEPSAGTVLQREPSEVAGPGGGRGRVEPGQQGAQAPGPVGGTQAEPVRQAGGDRGTQTPKPVAKKPPKPFSKADLERVLLTHHEQSRPDYTTDDETALANASSSGSAWTFFGKKLPGEVQQYLEGNPAARKLFSLTQDSTQAGGEDAMANMGDRYFQIADKLSARPKKKMMVEALATAEDSQDPQMQLAAAVYKNLPSKLPKHEVKDPKQLPTWSEFDSFGHHMRIEEDADGYRVLKDGEDFPVLPVEALDAIPVDKGTLKQSEPELPEGEVFPVTQAAGSGSKPPAPPNAPPAAATPEPEPSGYEPASIAEATARDVRRAADYLDVQGQTVPQLREALAAIEQKMRDNGELRPDQSLLDKIDRPHEANADLGRGGNSGFRKPPGKPPTPPAAPGQPPPGPAPTPAHLKSALYGPGSFVADVLAPKTKAIVGGLTEFVSQVRKAVAPQTRGQDAAKVARALREMMARRAVGDNRTLEAFKKASALFDGMSREASIEFWDNAERGKDQGDPALNMIAKQLVAAENALGQEVRRVAPGKLRQMITDKEYLGRIWKDPKKAGDVLAGILGKRPLEGRKGFLKQRSLDWFTDGIKAGLEPVTYNPVDMGLLKMAEMRRFIEMHRALNELKVNGLRKYVGINEDAPEGWETIDDAAFTVYGPPTVTASEGYDKGVREPLLRLAEKLGVKHVRKLALGGGKRGLSYTGQNKIETKYGTMDQVIAHELGHQIGDRWNLLHRLSKAPEPGIRTKRGQQKHRAKIAEQWRRLADLRHELTPDAPDYYKDYVRKGEEKEAVLLQAWVQARDKFRDVAPDLYRRWVDFLNKTPELHTLLHIEPSLDMGEDDYEIPHGGLLTMGHYYVPAEAAQLFRNILAPGLRQRSGLVRAWFAVNNVMNQTSLGISAFHAMGSAINAGISDVALALTRLARGEPRKAVMPLVRGATVGGSVAKYMYTGGKMLREWYKPGTTGGDIAELVKAAVMGGARAELSSAYRTDAMAGFRKALRQIKAEEGTAKLNPLAKALVKAPWAAVELTAWPIMQGLVPRIKFGAFAELARREMERLGPDADKDELRKAFAKAWDSIDNRFGQLVHDNAFWDPIVRDLAMGSVRSVGWNLGDVREIAGGMADLIGETAKAATGHKPELTDRTAFAFALPILVGALGAALMYALTGKKPRDLKDYYYPQTGELDGEGRPVRLSMPTYMKDVFGMVQHPLDTLKHKAAPLLSAVADVIENKDYHGVQVREGTYGQQAKQSVEHVVKSGMPFSVQQWQKMTEQGVPLAKRLMAATGFAQAPASVNDTPAEAKAKEITRAKAAVGGRTQKEADHANLKYKLVEAVKKDGEAGRKQVVKAAQARQISDREEVDILKRESQMSGLAYRVKHMALSDAMEIWKLANEKERKELRPIMVEKIAYSQDPDLDRPAKRKMIQSLGATTQPTTLPASMSE